MSDPETTLAALKGEILSFVRERDWEQFHSPKNLSMALAAEAAELMEHFLWVESRESPARLNEPGRREKVEEELADILIYALEFANMTGIDASRAIREKLSKNNRRYPAEQCKGRALKYDELPKAPRPGA